MQALKTHLIKDYKINGNSHGYAVIYELTDSYIISYNTMDGNITEVINSDEAKQLIKN